MTAVLALLVGACGGDDDESSGSGVGGRQGARGPEGRDRDRRGRGRGQPDRLGRLRRGRLDRPEGRLGVGLRAADRLPGQRQGRQHVRRDGDADAHRPVRRRVGVRRRDAAADRRRRRRAGQHGPDQELRRRVRRAQGQAAQLRRRADVRRPARPRREPADVAHRQGRPGARLVGRGVRPELAVQGQGDGVRQPDLHRRRGALPEGDPARPRDRQRLRARRQAVPGVRRPAQAAERASSASTGRTTRRSRPRSPAATRSSAPPGR